LPEGHVYDLLMVGPLLLYFFAVTVQQDGTAVRAGCGSDEAVVARLAAGTRVEIRFALADGSACYKVQAGEIAGWVVGSDLAGLDEFERKRRGGALVGESSPPAGQAPVAPQSPETGPAGPKNLTIRTSDPLLERASKLLDANEPRAALDALEPSLRQRPRDAAVLLVAGLAAYRADDLPGALDYWRDSLAVRPNPELEEMYRSVEREARADGSAQKVYGYRFQLRYEGTAVPAEVARTMVSVLDEEFSRVSAELGCQARDRIPVIVQSREAYLRTTGAAAWSGGQYDGRIHVALVEGLSIGPATRRVFAHEIVHACLANLGKWPAWLQEGIAQKLSGDVLDSSSKAELETLIQARAVPKLERLSQSWTRMDDARARVAYHLALAAADALYDGWSGYGIANLLRDPDRLPQVAAELDRRLGL